MRYPTNRIRLAVWSILVMLLPSLLFVGCGSSNRSLSSHARISTEHHQMLTRATEGTALAEELLYEELTLSPQPRDTLPTTPSPTQASVSRRLKRLRLRTHTAASSTAREDTLLLQQHVTRAQEAQRQRYSPRLIALGVLLGVVIGIGGYRMIHRYIKKL